MTPINNGLLGLNRNNFQALVNRGIIDLESQVQYQRLPIYVQSLIVAGGGSGSGGGGGAGGLLLYSSLAMTRGMSYSVSVGSGGIRTNTGPLGWGGEHGQNSTIQGGPLNIVAIGGGGGSAGNYVNGSNNQSGYIGGSGGSGGGAGNNANVTGVAMTGGNGTPGQGNKGGDTVAVSGSPGAGGGGYTSPGSGQAGGQGLESSIISTTTAITAGVGHVSSGKVYFAGGGSGGSYNVGVGAATLGGGGAGRTYISGYSSSQDGLPHTGGGGGGGHNSNGGSGVIIFRFTQALSYIATGNYAAYIESSDTIIIFKGSGTIQWI